jgi:hypothetical protein
MNKPLEMLKNIWDTFLVLSVLAILVFVLVLGVRYFITQNKKVSGPVVNNDKYGW